MTKQTHAPEQPQVPTTETPDAAAVLAKVSRSIVPLGYRERLVKHAGVKTAGGNAAIDNADAVAGLLRGKTLEEVWAIASAALGSDVVVVLKSKYAALNPGQVRMNLGNRIRGAVKAGFWKVPA